MIRTIDVREISKNIKEMCIEANHYLSKVGWHYLQQFVCLQL